MRKTLSITKSTDGLWLDNDITYTQVPGWLGNATRDLKLSVIKHFDTTKKLPVIFWFSGGGWMDSNHNIHLPNLVELAKRGYIIVGVEYRDSNKINFPGQLQDAKAAIRYIKTNANKFGINPNKIIAMGESAGGHLASMLGVTNGLKKFDIGNYLDIDSNINLAIPWYGVVNPLAAKTDSTTTDFDFVYRNLLGAEPEISPDLNAAANPITYINKDTVPFLILHGTNDAVVPLSNSEDLYNALQNQNISVDLYAINGAQHMDELFLQPEIMTIIDKFIKNNI